MLGASYAVYPASFLLSAFRLKRTQKSDHELARYYREKEQKASAQLRESSVDVQSELRSENAILTEDNEQLELQKEQLRQRLEEALQDNEILRDRVEDLEEKNQEEYDFRTHANGRPYSDAFRTCVWDLLSMNLAQHNINNAITCVLKLVGKSMKNKPSVNTIAELSTARLAASQQQLEVYAIVEQNP